MYFWKSSLGILCIQIVLLGSTDLVLKADESSIVADQMQLVACILRDQVEQALPAFSYNPLIFREKDGTKNHVLTFTHMIGTNPKTGERVTEACHGIIGKTLEDWYFGTLQPEARYIQESRCIGRQGPGYDAELPFHMTMNEVETIIWLNNSKIFQSRTKPLVPGQMVLGMERWGGDVESFPKISRNKNYVAYQTLNPGKDSLTYVRRAKVSARSDFTFQPVSVALPQHWNDVMDAQLSVELNVHSCMRFDRRGPASHITFNGVYVLGAHEQAPYRLFDQHMETLREALDIDRNDAVDSLEHDILNLMQSVVDEPALHEPHWAKAYRHVQAVFDLTYPFFTMFQKYAIGHFPSKRFKDVSTRLMLHALVGLLLTYLGTILHVLHECTKPVFMSQEVGGHDEETWRLPFYYTLASLGLVQGLSVYSLMNKVMGERRIGIPLYFGAGTANIVNSVVLFVNPTLRAAFRLWGSVSIFILVRYGMLALSFAAIDWDLLYTYALPVSILVGYPATLQDENMMWIIFLPILYAPLHGRICRLMGWSEEGDSNNSGSKDLWWYKQVMNMTSGAADKAEPTFMSETRAPDASPLSTVSNTPTDVSSLSVLHIASKGSSVVSSLVGSTKESFVMKAMQYNVRHFDDFTNHSDCSYRFDDGQESGRHTPSLSSPNFVPGLPPKLDNIEELADTHFSLHVGYEHGHVTCEPSCVGIRIDETLPTVQHALC